MSFKSLIHIINGKHFFVKRIIDFSHKERYFSFFDLERPFNFKIIYKELSTESEIRLNINPYIFSDKVKLEKEYNFNLSEQECLDNIKEIENKRKIIVDKTNTLNKIILEFEKNNK